MEIGTPNDNPFPGAVTMKYEGYCTCIFPLEIWHFIHLLYFSMIKFGPLKKIWSNYNKFISFFIPCEIVS